MCVPCGANTGEAETVVVRAVMRNAVVMKARCGIRLLSKVFGQNCSKTPNMGWIVDWRGWEGPEVPGMEVRFFPMAARSTVRGSQLE